ncbi:MAG TPA: hypothetical protein PKE03_06875 [Bacteroidales bacterium]|nr:hypothetical protein [Bacteroidales bacterium]
MKMHAILSSLVLFSLLAFDAQAQNDAIQRPKADGSGGFGGFIYEISPVLGSTGISQGGGGAYLRNNFFIGGFGMSLLTSHYKPVVYLHPDDNSGKPMDYAGEPVFFDYGGLWLGKIFPIEQDLTITASGMFGWGQVGWDPDISDKRRRRMYRIEENIFVINPRVVATYQPLRWLRLEAGVGYRAAFPSNKQYLDVAGPGASRWRNFFDPAEFSATTFNFGVMFGAF